MNSIQAYLEQECPGNTYTSTVISRVRYTQVEYIQIIDCICTFCYKYILELESLWNKDITTYQPVLPRR